MEEIKNQLPLADNAINEELTEKMKESEIHKRFMKWGEENGLKYHPSLMVPAAFGSVGVPGIAAKDKIGANTVIAAVPNKMLISLKKIKKGELSEIFKDRENGELFDDKRAGDAEFNVFAAFLIFEKLKGEQSFFKPYFDTIIRSYTMYDWTEEEVAITECPELIDEFPSYLEELETTWRELKMCLVKYPHFFKEEDLKKDIFLWSYELIMTRVFGYSLPCSCLVPFGDLFNHGNHSATHYIINKRFEEDQSLAHEQYIIKKHRIDISVLQNKEEESLIPEDNDFHFRSKRLLFVKDHHKVLPEGMRNKYDWDKVDYLEDNVLRDMVYEINTYELEKNKEINIWDLKYYTTSATEDNDTDEDQTEGRQTEYKNLLKNEIKIVETAQLRSSKIDKSVVESKERGNTAFEQILLRKNIKEEEKEGQGCKDIKVRKEDEDKSSEGEESGYEEGEDEEEEEEKEDKVDKTKQDIAKEEMKEQKQEKKEKEDEDDDEDDSVDEYQESSLSDDSEFDWYESDDKNTYFAVATEQPVQAGDQVFLCYGRRTNRFLLQWYGFAFQDNIFDSFSFRMWIKPDPHALVKDIERQIIFRRYIGEDDWKRGFIMHNGLKVKTVELTKEFRLKRGKLCNEFLVYLRIYLSNHYTNIDISKILFTLPRSLDFELYVFQFAKRILTYMQKQYTTTLEDDQVRLKNEQLPYKLRFALTLRLDHKKILLEQIEIVESVITILSALKAREFDLKEYLADKSAEKVLELGNEHTNDLKSVYTLNFENFQNEKDLLVQRHKIKGYLNLLYQGIFKKYSS